MKTLHGCGTTSISSATLQLNPPSSGARCSRSYGRCTSAVPWQDNDPLHAGNVVTEDVTGVEPQVLAADSSDTQSTLRPTI